MKLDRWKEVEHLYEAAISLPSDKRGPFLADSGTDEEIRRKVESLLEQRENLPSFLERRGLDVAAEIIARSEPGTLVGRMIDRYEVQAFLGAGGMGEVYKARDTRLRRDVAVKVLSRKQVTADVAAWERFQREARTASALSHPNICSVHDAGEADGQLYLVMELLEGVTLREHIGEHPLETGAALAIAVQIAHALEAAHKKGIIHRDVKPANVMLVGHGHVKVLDFGLAKQTPISDDKETLTLETLSAVGTVMGSPQYLSPEVLQGAKADARSDLWAFGVVLYQMLSGRLPFTGATMLEISSSILKEQPPALPGNVPAGLRVIVDRCLAKRPEERYQNGTELLAALERIRTGGTNRRTWLRVAGAVAVLAASGVIWWQRSDTAGPRLSTGGPVSPSLEANELFERSMVLQREQSAVPQALALLEQALKIDPHFAEAHRYHAFQQVIHLLNGYSNDPSVLQEAERELQQLAREAPDLPSLPSAQAAVYMAMGRKDLIPIEDMNRVIDKNPNNNTTRNQRMMMNTFAEKNDEAKREARGMLDRDWRMVNARVTLAEILRTEGDTPGAIKELTRVLEQGGYAANAIRRLAAAYMDSGEVDKARALLEEKKHKLSENYLWRLTWALLLAVEGKRDAAINAMDEQTLKFAEATFYATVDAAEFYAVLGDTDKALEWLDRAIRNGDERAAWFRRNPRLANIQKDPRFLRLIENLEARRNR
jgi:tetratricopeptide (TPR) repeat protein